MPIRVRIPLGRPNQRTFLAMEGPLIVNRHERPIRSVRAWGVFAKPASPVHWQDGRSAKELAKAWIDGSGPAALTELLARDPRTANLRIKQATAEAQTAFDSLPGGRRNHDLLIEAEAAGGTTIVGLEGKADESFRQTLDGYCRAAKRKAERGEPTNAPRRLEGLLADLTGTTLEARPDLGKLRYQLFASVAGTLAAAGPGDQAAFVAHEFKTPKTTKRRRNANATALASFVEQVFGRIVPAAEDWWLVGPFRAPAARWSRTRLWIGHLTTGHEQDAADG
jgi:hypothetical protein